MRTFELEKTPDTRRVPRDCAAGAEHRDAGLVGVDAEGDLGRRRRHTADSVEAQVAEVAEPRLQCAAKDPEIEHIAAQMEHVGMEKQRGEHREIHREIHQRGLVEGASRDEGWVKRIPQDIVGDEDVGVRKASGKLLSARHFRSEDRHVREDQDVGHGGEGATYGPGGTQRNDRHLGAPFNCQPDAVSTPPASTGALNDLLV